LAAKKEKQNKSSRPPLRTADIVVIVLCFVGTLTSLGLFWRDLFQTVQNRNALPLGIISFKYNTAQRRLTDRVLWDRLRQESPVYDGDIIRTADLSEATIRFGGGREINLTENTLIRIRMRAGDTEIDLTDGEVNLGASLKDERTDDERAADVKAADGKIAGGKTVDVKTTGGKTTGGKSNDGKTGGKAGGKATDKSAGDKIVLNVGDKRVEAGSDAVLSASAREKELAVQVAQGNAIFSGSGGQRRTVTAGTAVTVKTTGTESNAVSDKPAVIVSSPWSNAQFLAQRQGPLPITFTWKKINIPASEALQLEVSETRSFTQIYQSVSAAGSNARAELPPGAWFWRIKRSTENTVLASGRLTVLYSASPSLIAPAQGYVFQYRVKAPSIRFQWRAMENVSYYTVEAANNSNFSNPRITLRVRGTYLDTSDLEAGTWYWRVTPVFSGENQGTALSASSSFRIEQSGALNAPTLTSPETGNTVYLGVNRNIYFSWKKEKEARSYTIQIAQNRDLRNPVIKQEVKDNVFVYRQESGTLSPGQYYWGVFQTDIQGDQSALSVVQPFTAASGEPVQRALFPPDNYVIAEALLPDIRFTWKSDSFSNARFQISSASNFSRLLVDEKVFGESFRGRPLAPGTYYWRIAAEDPVLQAPGRQFVVVSSLPAPVPESPANGGRLVLRPGEQLALRWRPVNRAEQYTVRIYSGTGASRRPLYDQTIAGTTLQLPGNNFANGDYYWTIQASAEERANATRLTGLASEQRFSIRRLQSLTLDSPETGAEISGPVVLRWNTAETLGKSRFVLSQNSNPLRGAPVQEILNPERSITIDRLKEGVYYWTIVAETQDGYDISAAAPRRFRMLPNLLNEPAGLSPATGMVIGPEALRASRNIVFNWEPVEDAHAYIFSLFRVTDTGRQQLVRTEPRQETSWTLENLQLLGEGDFVWQVEAVRQGRGGAIEERGHVGENNFRLEIPMPEQVQIPEAGILYGK